MPDTPAEEAGLQAGDVVFEINGKRWLQPGASEHFQAEIMAHRPGEVVRLGLRRAGEPALIERQVKLVRRPPIPDMAQLFLLPGQEQPDPARLKIEEEDRFFKQWYDRRLADHRAGQR
jgi:predicted metalloprotease with PDZ domain